MKIIVGLGNPGRRYAGTPHNLGFDTVDELAGRWSLNFQENRRARAEVAEGQIAGQPAMLIKPLTFMNLSGEAVSEQVRNRQFGPDDLLVITDEVYLPLGRLRIRPNGSHGGHNGLRSVIERLGHDQFPRLRVGIQPPWEFDDRVAFVLSRLPPREQQQLGEMAAYAADAAEFWVREGTEATAGKFNRRRFFEE